MNKNQMQLELFPLLPGPFIVYVARHATPDRSRYDIPYNSLPGPELTERGLREAAELGEFLRQAGVRHSFASPFVRAWHTAQIASGLAGAVLEQDADLCEWRLDETEKLVRVRLERAFVRAAQLSAQVGPVGLVSHGSPVLTLLKTLGLPADEAERFRIFDSRNLIPMGGAWRVEMLDGELHLQLVFAPNGVRLPEYCEATRLAVEQAPVAETVSTAAQDDTAPTELEERQPVDENRR